MAGIRIIGLEAATAEVKAAVAVGIREGIGIAAAQAEQMVKQNISSGYAGMPPRIATRNLVNSIQFNISQSTGITRAIVFAGPPADTYVDPVEFGARAHFPPPNALLLWVKLKFRVSSEAQAKSIAFAVARKIARTGMRAFQMFGRAIETLQPQLQGIMEAAIARALTAAGVGGK